MWKNVLAGTTAMAIVGGSLAYAQQMRGGPGGAEHWHPNAEDITAFADARIAALHAGLKLNADQEKNWPAVESAMRERAKQRAARFAARSGTERPKDPIERLKLRADIMEQRGGALKKFTDAIEPLYKSLDEAQKHRFVMLARFNRQRFAGLMGEDGRHGYHEWRHHGSGGAGGGQGKTNQQPQ